MELNTGENVGWTIIQTMVNMDLQLNVEEKEREDIGQTMFIF